MDTTHALDALLSLTPDAITPRLAKLEVEAKGMRSLLRAVIARERAAPHDDAPGDTDDE